MLNKYPLWKNLVIVIALVIGFVYALPNVFPDDFAVQITGARSSTEVDQRILDRAVDALEAKGIQVKESELQERDALIRLNDAESQLRARPVVQEVLGRDYLVALNMAPSTPGWLESLGAGPMKIWKPPSTSASKPCLVRSSANCVKSVCATAVAMWKATVPLF